jgi:hypothetical protein
MSVSVAQEDGRANAVGLLDDVVSSAYLKGVWVGAVV